MSAPTLSRLEPSTESELADLVRASAAAGTHLAPTGLGSSMAWCRPEFEEGTSLLSTRSLVPPGTTGIVEYVPGDGTLTAHAGARMHDLVAAVAEGGHEITPWIRTDSTLGGVLAAGRSGPCRVAFGPMRHHVLGLRFVDGTGRAARSGGRLVKNVTGFDLHRLHAGARGTLGVIVEASLRLMPAPERTDHAVSHAYDSTTAAIRAALAVRAQRSVRPRALFVRGRVVHVLLAGRAAQLESERLLVDSSIDVADWSTDAAPALEASAHETALRILTSPSQVTTVSARLESVLGATALDHAHVEPDAAIIDLDRQAIARDPEAWLTDLLPGFDRDAVLLEPRLRLDKSVLAACRDRLSLPPAAQRWTARLTDAFDPGGVFRAPGFPPTPR